MYQNRGNWKQPRKKFPRFQGMVKRSEKIKKTLKDLISKGYDFGMVLKLILF